MPKVWFFDGTDDSIYADDDLVVVRAETLEVCSAAR